MHGCITSPCAELRRYSLVRVSVGWRGRLLEQPGERCFPRCAIERVGRLAERFTLKQAFDKSGHRVRSHYQ
jgi:hypothetical protein